MPRLKCPDSHRGGLGRNTYPQKMSNSGLCALTRPAIEVSSRLKVRGWRQLLCCSRIPLIQVHSLLDSRRKVSNMKVNAFSVAAGLAGSLILSSAASAAYQGLVVQNKSAGARGFFVCNVWACFDNAADRLLSITGATITSSRALFQRPFGTSTAPTRATSRCPASRPCLDDSFVTIGLKSFEPGFESRALSPAAFSTSGFSGGWFNSNPDNQQGAPVADASVVRSSMCSSPEGSPSRTPARPPASAARCRGLEGPRWHRRDLLARHVHPQHPGSRRLGAARSCWPDLPSSSRLIAIV